MASSDLSPGKAYLMRGSTIKSLQKRDDDLWAGKNIQRGPGILRRGSGSAGFTLASKSNGQPSPASPFPAADPFEIAIRTNPSNPALYQAMVNPDSTLMVSGKPNNNLTITGLGTWFPFIANDVIALYIVVSSLTAISATIQSYGLGTTTFDPTLDAWASTQNGYIFDNLASPPAQIGINILLGYSTPDAHGKPYFVQAQFEHLLLEDCFINGESAIFDFSHRERYGITAP